MGHMQWHAVSTKDVGTLSKLDLEFVFLPKLFICQLQVLMKTLNFFYKIWYILVISNQIIEFQETFQPWNVLHKQTRLYYTFLHNWFSLVNSANMKNSKINLHVQTVLRVYTCIFILWASITFYHTFCTLLTCILVVIKSK